MTEIRIPDIGNAKDVDVIAISVKPGDHIKPEDALITLESDKASMDIPSPVAGIVKEIKIKLGDKVNKGDLFMLVDAETVDAPTAEQPVSATQSTVSGGEQASVIDVVVPDIGNAKHVDVIAVLVKAGDHINVDDAMLTLESDKASMDIPAAKAGVVQVLAVKVGDKVSKGDVILKLLPEAATVTEKSLSPAATTTIKPEPQHNSISPPDALKAETPTSQTVNVTSDDLSYATPSLRRFARELGVDLAKVKGTGRKGRILQTDVSAYVKQIVSNSGSGGASPFSFAAAPEVDFSQFGQIEIQELSRIKKKSGVNLHRNWVTIPHVTQFDEADITELEKFRQANKVLPSGAKLTPLVFLMKAVVVCLKVFPNFNSSLDVSGEKLILKKYFNLGVAVDTPDGLVVPVIKNVDQKSLFELAEELNTASERARDKKLSPDDFQGSCFSISSLGGIGGTAFTPIVNAPDVAILGVSKSQMKPVYQNQQFVPRLMLPLSLSYDHRVIDGAAAARFITRLCAYLSDIRKLLL